MYDTCVRLCCVAPSIAQFPSAIVYTTILVSNVTIAACAATTAIAGVHTDAQQQQLSCQLALMPVLSNALLMQPESLAAIVL
jgi:hypothetical protein